MTNDIIDLKKILADAAKNEQLREKIGTNIGYISTRNKKFSIGDNALGEKVDVVVAMTAFENAYYDSPYIKGETSAPGCFAVSLSGEDMTSHETSPNRQHKKCDDCKNAQWGSALVGKGKACKNGRRLVCLGVNSDGSVDHTQVAVLKLSPTSLAGWAKYAKTVAITQALPTWAVITTLSFDPEETYPKIISTFKGLVQTDDLGKIYERQKEFETIALQPYNVEKYVRVTEQAKSKMS